MNIAKIGSQALDGIQTITQKAAAKISKEVPVSDLPVAWWDFPMPYEVFEAKKLAYINKLYATYFDENGKVIPEIKQFLDESVFNMKIGGGRMEKQVTSTIKNHISSSIHDVETVYGELYHGAMKPDALLNEGFNTRYINRTNLGPGFYFAGEGEAREYGTVIAAKIRESGATAAKADDRFYEGLPIGDAASKLSKFLGFKTDKYSEEMMIQQDFVSKIINEYSRDFIVNELGIDILKGYGGATPFDYCTCVLNPDIFEKIYRH